MLSPSKIYSFKFGTRAYQSLMPVLHYCTNHYHNEQTRRRVMRLTPVCLSLLFVLWGFLSPSARNLIGIGTAMAVLSIGFQAFFLGRFRIQDFWE